MGDELMVQYLWQVFWLFCFTDLAREGAEMEGFLKDPVTCQADVAGALERPGLRPWLQEDHLGTVDRVGLHNERELMSSASHSNLCNIIRVQ